MIDKFDAWQYRDDNNCWDFVREFLVDRAGVPADDVPKFGICPDNKREMTRAAVSVARSFEESAPVQFAIACQFHGKTLIHVGIVDGGIIRHTGSSIGVRKDTIANFERQSQNTTYMLHKKLWLD